MTTSVTGSATPPAAAIAPHTDATSGGPTGTVPATAVLLAGLLIGAVLAGCGTTAISRPSAGAATRAQMAAQSFLLRYVDSDGRVVRHDQGGDTVSEGEAYALLLDVATGNRTQFSSVWAWCRAHLLQHDGLLAFHWANGAVVDSNPASDADLDVARALLLAGSIWAERSLTEAGKTYAASILANETVDAAGRTWLVAGPWARSAPYYVDPSYYDPATFALLGARTGDSRWSAVATSSAMVLDADTHAGKSLPSDWAQVDGSGSISPSSPPGGGPVLYSYDAFRTLVREDDTCSPGPGTRLDVALVPLATKAASAQNKANSYNTDATPSQGGDNPLMLFAAAGATHAAGELTRSNSYLDQATLDAKVSPSYYLDAWTALSRYLLTTTVLSGCAR